MKIRNAKKKDLGECEKLFSAKELEFPGGGSPDKNFLKSYLQKDYFLVLEDNGRIKAAIISEPIKNSYVAIWYLAVEKRSRGKGYGTELLREFEGRMRKKKKAGILLYGFKDNKQTVKFYEKVGFTKGTDHIEFTKYLSPNNS